MLELDDIQHFLMTRPHALAARYEFLSFRTAEGGRDWLGGILDKVGAAQAVKAASENDTRWVTVAFTWNGLACDGGRRGLSRDVPDEFREGMAARAEVLGDTGHNHPEHWMGGLASGPACDRHSVRAGRRSAGSVRPEYDEFLARCNGVERLSALDLAAIPPYEYSHDHFGYRDRLSQLVSWRDRRRLDPGSGAPLKAGEFFLGYPDEDGAGPGLPRPEVLSRNGSYLAYRRLQEHVGAFRDFLRAARARRTSSRNCSQQN